MTRTLDDVARARLERLTRPLGASLDDLIAAPIARNASRECECGNRKGPQAAACERCSYLDGRADHTALVIDTLRGTNGLSLRELCETIYGECDNANTRRSMLRTMQALERAGRVRRYAGEGDEAVSVGWHGYESRHRSHCWIYQLWGAG